MRSWPVVGSRQNDADERLAEHLGIEPDSTGRFVHELLVKKAHVPQLEVRIRRIVDWIEPGGRGIDPDPAVEIVIRDQATKKARTVYLHTYLMRLLQRCFLLAVADDTEIALPDTCHAYRRRRNPSTALAAVQKNIRDGYHYVVAVDIRRFFDSCTAELVSWALDRQAWLGRRMRTIAMWTMRTHVLRRPRRGERIDPREHWYKPAPHLLQGAPLASWLANIVGAEVIDRPMSEMANEVRLVRYSDNIMIAGTTAADCESGLDKLRRLLGGAGLALQDEAYRPIDVHRERVHFLGAIVHGRSIQTPNEKVNQRIAKIVAEPFYTARCRGLCAELRGLLRFEPARFPYVQRRLGPAHAYTFAEVAGLLDPDPWADDDVMMWAEEEAA